MTVSRASLAGLAALAALALAGCSSGGGQASPSGSASGASAAACPATPLTVTVSVDQWGSIASDIAGACATVTSLIASSAVDPHDYEPTTAEANAMAHSDLIVLNGADYDHWARDLATSAAPGVPVVDIAELNGVADDDNPHLWYSPDYVFAAGDELVAKLSELSPAAADVFQDNHAAWLETMQPYSDTIAALKTHAAGRSYGASEPVFDYMAEAIGLVNLTPSGYQAASGHHSEPSPGDLQQFQDLLATGGVDVFVYNTQTEGALTDQLRQQAEAGSVPIVDVTESMPDGVSDFATWQVGQLDELAKALGVTP